MKTLVPFNVCRAKAVAAICFALVFVSFSGQAVATETPETSGGIAPPAMPKNANGYGKEVYQNDCEKAGYEAYNRCIVKTNANVNALGSWALPACSSGSGINNNSGEGSCVSDFGKQSNAYLAQECTAAGRDCVSKCQKASQKLSKMAQDKVPCANSTSQQAAQCKTDGEAASTNARVASEGANVCGEYFADIVKRSSGQTAHMGGAGQQYGDVGDKTRSVAATGASNYPQLGGPDGAKGEKEDDGMNPWMAGALGAGVGGLAGYMFGKKKGEKEGYKKGKKDGEKGDDDDDDDDDDDESASNTCDSEESATLPNCQESFLVKCDQDPTATGCSAFTSHYCDSTGTTQPNAAFCRKQAAHNYCSQSDSANRNNCPSCRELANNFSGQYSPEDLANSCSLCTNDPICTANGGALYAYQNQYGSAPGSNPLPKAVLPAGGAGAGSTTSNVDPSQRYSDNTSSPGRQPSGEQNGQNGVGGNGGQGSFPGFGGGNETGSGSGSVFAANTTGQRVGANQVGIASSFGHSNFRIHSQVIQRSCQRGTMVGCGPLAGVQAGGGGTSGAQ
ncbi:MAG: hypothetical protein H6624_00540 [Bdellovibrionaceae bacterium]|nr:hypothetical protein [Bdellovibrionales bacterium]MCB9082795.1 hypothetical protein [Pseudobdellovibrionaceae bacterium]